MTSVYNMFVYSNYVLSELWPSAWVPVRLLYRHRCKCTSEGGCHRKINLLFWHLY